MCRRLDMLPEVLEPIPVTYRRTCETYQRDLSFQFMSSQCDGFEHIVKVLVAPSGFKWSRSSGLQKGWGNTGPWKI